MNFINQVLDVCGIITIKSTYTFTCQMLTFKFIYYALHFSANA